MRLECRIRQSGGLSASDFIGRALDNKQVEIVDAREDTECPGCLLLTLEIADCCLETMLMPALASLAVGTPHIVAQ